jgi:hypothetical protein
MSSSLTHWLALGSQQSPALSHANGIMRGVSGPAFSFHEAVETLAMLGSSSQALRYNLRAVCRLSIGSFTTLLQIIVTLQAGLSARVLNKVDFDFLLPSLSTIGL